MGFLLAQTFIFTTFYTNSGSTEIHRVTGSDERMTASRAANFVEKPRSQRMLLRFSFSFSLNQTRVCVWPEQVDDCLCFGARGRVTARAAPGWTAALPHLSQKRNGGDKLNWSPPTPPRPPAAEEEEEEEIRACFLMLLLEQEAAGRRIL